MATKAAAEQLTHVFSKEVGARGINVNSLSPGPTNTELFTKNLRKLSAVLPNCLYSTVLVNPKISQIWLSFLPAMKLNGYPHKILVQMGEWLSARDLKSNLFNHQS